MKKNSPVVMILMTILAIMAGVMEVKGARNAGLKLNPEQSIVDLFESKGMNSRFENRRLVAAKYGYSNYRGTYTENVGFLAKLRGEAITETPEKETSVVKFLKAKGEDSSFENRSIRAKEFNIPNYKGTKRQNLKLLTLLKEKLAAETKVEAVQPVVEATPEVASTTVQAPPIVLPLELETEKKALEPTAETEAPMPEKDLEPVTQAEILPLIPPSVVTLDGRDHTITDLQKVVEAVYTKWKGEKNKSVIDILPGVIPEGLAYIDARKRPQEVNRFVEKHLGEISQKTIRQLVEMKNLTKTWEEVNTLQITIGELQGPPATPVVTPPPQNVPENKGEIPLPQVSPPANEFGLAAHVAEEIAVVRQRQLDQEDLVRKHLIGYGLIGIIFLVILFFIAKAVVRRLINRRNNTKNIQAVRKDPVVGPPEPKNAIPPVSPVRAPISPERRKRQEGLISEVQRGSVETTLEKGDPKYWLKKPEDLLPENLELLLKGLPTSKHRKQIENWLEPAATPN